MGEIFKSGLLKSHINQSTRRVMLAFQHGLGDVLSFRSVFNSIKLHWPNIHFDLGLNRSMGYQRIVPEAVLITSLEQHAKEYDIVFIIKYHMEDFTNPNLTKSEKCCRDEIGISPIGLHVPIKAAPLIAVHFNSTCMPAQLGCPEKIAKNVWDDIVSCGCVPIETHFVHKFHNPENKKFKFIDMNCRDFSPNTESLAAIINSSFAFVGVASGNLHLALSILPAKKIFMLANRIKPGHVTKLSIESASIARYKGEVKDWLKHLLKK